MYRLLLHIGLPKTATSSLQCNVLMPLYEQRRINFLGRCVRDGKVFDPFEGVLDRMKARRLTAGELRELRSEVEAGLDRTRLNVLSNEHVSAMYTGLGNEHGPYDGRIRLDNLARLFRGCDTTVLISLRSPVDFVFAWYVERYYWRFYAGDEHATIDRFLSRLLRQGSADGPWIAFFFDAYLRAAARSFDCIDVLLYEDLKHDSPFYFSKIARGLQSDPEEIELMFGQARRNAGVYTPSGKLSRRLSVRHLVRRRFPALMRGYARARPMLERVPALVPLLRRLADVETAVRAEHRYPDAEARRRLQECLGLRDDYLTRAHGVSEAKLARYGYLHPSRAARRAQRESG